MPCTPYRDLVTIAAKLRKQGYLRSFRTDLIKHDKAALKGYCGPYLWAIRDHGTHLATPKSVCYWKNNKAAWDNMTSGRTFGPTLRIYYSKHGEAPRPVSGAVPGRVAAGWEKACAHHFDPWTGKQLDGAHSRRAAKRGRR